MAWTGFGGSWSGGVNSGGDSSGSIGGGSGGTRVPSTANIASQFNSFGGTQINAADVSNIRSDGNGGYYADIRGQTHAVSLGGSSHTSTTVGGFTGLPDPGSGTGTNANGGSALTSNPATNNKRNKDVAAGLLNHAKAEAKTRADNRSKANFNITQAQTRLNTAKTKAPALQAAVATAHKKFDAAQKYAASMARYASAPPISNLFREWQRAGYEAGKAQNALKAAEKALANNPAEIAAAEKALGNARKAAATATTEKRKADQAVTSASEMVNAITTATTFFESVTKKFGNKAALTAQQFADDSRGKTIRSKEQALAIFEKHKGTGLSRLNASDKQAIVNAFKSLENAVVAKQLKAYSKVFGNFNAIMDVKDLAVAVKKGLDTGDYRDAINKLESLAASRVAGELVAIAFATAGAPLGIVGFGLTMMLTGVLFSNEKVLTVINSSLGLK